MNTDMVAILQQSDFFRGLSPETCQRVAARLRSRELRKRETLFLEQARGDAMFLLVRGAVQLSKTTPGGDDIVIRTVRPGEVFAEVILFEGTCYPVTAVALSPSRVLSFHRTDVLRLLDERGFRNEFVAMLMRKQRYLAERVRSLTSYDVEERFLLFLREHYGEAEELHPAMSKKDIAAAIGATPETFSRLIGKMKQRRVLSWEGHKLRVRRDLWKTVDGL